MSDSAASAAIDINFCPHCKADWIKAPDYLLCWKCHKAPTTVAPATVAPTVSASREPDDNGDPPIDIAAAANAAAKAAKDGSFWMAFQNVAKEELVSYGGSISVGNY